ncbi:Zn2Cys6 transcriptional regulator [Trichoderma parareesei]|uniref:Zn2Cys6 transcriptional regulator n=1 Tax=Trichoderma parareesei TaxID=858221 RepID=A0A2H2Z4X7_TRIPA|nr:Zn2Cys6 transcriptional regulator [Trichoderma parareesei]
MQDRPSPPSKKHRRLASERADSADQESSLAEDSITPAQISARTPTSASSSSESIESSSESTAPNPDTAKQAARRRPVRKAVNVACESCRKRKIKIECQYASAYREETISAALKRKYQEENKKSSSYEEFFTALQNCSEDDAMTMFSLVRQGVDPGALLRQMKEGDLLLQLSVVPETRRRYQFPYLAAMPLHLQTPDNPYLNSVLYETAFHGVGQQGSLGSALPQRGMASRYQNIYLQPYHAAELLDPLIDHVKPSKWTMVSTDDHLMRTLLRAYILHEYPTFPIFHKDIFFQAMIDEDTQYCTPMLVNALLAEACHSFIGIPNRHQFWVPQSLRYRFLAEAKRLWELESDRVDLVTVQAATLLNLIYSHNGMDKVGQPYLMHGLRLAQQLELFGDHAHVKNQRMIHARVFTAWALFNWQCIQSYYYYRAPLIPDPPATPLPDPDGHPFWYGDFKLRYPLNPTLVPAHYGHYFKAVSGLRLIIHDMATISYSQKEERTVSPRQIWSIFSRLEKWYLGLPAVLSPRNIVFPWQLKVHMELYLATILFSTKQADVSEASTLMKETAQKTAAHAAARLETVARLYYIRHSFEYCDPFLTIHLSFIAGGAMDSLKLTPAHDVETIKSLKSTIILSLKGLYDQGQHIHLTSVIYRLLRDRLSPEDLALLQNYVVWDPLAPEEPLLVQYAQSHYPLTMGSKHQDPSSTRLENLVKQYGQLSTEDSQ